MVAGCWSYRAQFDDDSAAKGGKQARILGLHKHGATPTEKQHRLVRDPLARFLTNFLLKSILLKRRIPVAIGDASGTGRPAAATLR